MRLRPRQGGRIHARAHDEWVLGVFDFDLFFTPQVGMQLLT